MRRIHKKEEPERFRNWKKDKSSWKEIDDKSAIEIKRELKSTLVKEQNYNCCYCGELIDPLKPGDVVIEHIESRADNPEKIFLYENLLASCHGNGYMSRKGTSYKKSDWYTCDSRKEARSIEVTPLCENCEGRCLFTDDGSIVASDVSDEAFKNTINTLGLNASSLNLKRREVFIEYFPDDESKEDQEYIEKLIECMNTIDENGKIPRFSYQVSEYAKSFQLI